MKTQPSIARPYSAEVSPPPPAQRASSSDVSPHDVSVLLVDDSPSNLIALSAVLKPLGVNLVEAHSGTETIEWVKLQPFAVVLLDVQMPAMDGFEVARRLRETDNGRELPILFVTATHREEVFIRNGYAAGAADYITKPYDADVMRARVKAFVDLFRQREALRRREVSERTRERDEAMRRLSAFERIATTALESDALGTFLNELLAVLLDAVDSADSAAVLLRDGDVLRVHASLSRAGERPELYDTRVGEGFAGRIAATGQPLYMSSAVDSALIRRDFRRLGALRGLFGVPLVSGGEIIGVVHVSSITASDFPEGDKRLLVAVAERAASAVTKQQLRDRTLGMLMSSPSAILMLKGPEHTCDFANTTARAMYAGRDPIGLPLSALGAGSEVLAVVNEVASTGQIITRDELPLTLDWRGGGRAEERLFRFTAQPTRNASGSIDGVLIFALDVTAQVQARRQLEETECQRSALLERERAARAEAEIANRAKDDFLSTVSHELRTPLNAMLGWAMLARRDAPPALDRALATIERNARAQAKLINDVLDVSRITSGKLRLELGPVDVAATIGGASEAVRPARDARGIALDVDVSPDVGIISADADRLQQIVWNLLSNAIKFTPKGGRVSLRARRVEGSVTIEVTDTGQGIRREFLEHLFEPFWQADSSTTRRHGGLGLGLSIVKKLVQAHGGSITAASPGEGRGSTFTVGLPADRGAVPESSTADALLSGQAQGAASPRLDGLRVMIVDDEEDARSLLDVVLKDQGAVVSCVSSGAAALEQIESFRPDVLVSDIGMPDMDGYSLIRAIRALPSERGGGTPAVALTAYARSEDNALAYGAGFQMYLAKPVETSRLVVMLASLGGSR